MRSEGGPAPRGSDESQSVELGDPQRIRPGQEDAERGRPLPDFDARNERFARPRKPMGPPLEEGEDQREDAPRAPQVPEEPPVDPAEP